MSFPPAPTSAIDWSNLGFRVQEVNGHVECHYKNGAWSGPKFVEDPYLRLHGLAPGLNYGQQCYEGLKAFRSKDGEIRIFRPDQNAKRMAHSASFICIPAVPTDLFLECVHMAVGLNADWVPPHETGAAMYIRPLLLASVEQLGLNPPSDQYSFYVYVLPVGVYHGVHPVDALILENFDRAAPEGTGSAKVGGNYAPVLKHAESARAQGFGITLHLDSKTRTYIDEFSTSGFIGLKHGSGEGKPTMVMPLSDSVIDSVTANSCADIATSLGWTLEKRPVHFDELTDFDECMAAGTAAALVPIKSITLQSKDFKVDYIKDDQPGPCFDILMDNLKGIQRGIKEDSFGWCQLVTDPKLKKANGTAS